MNEMVFFSEERKRKQHLVQKNSVKIG